MNGIREIQAHATMSAEFEETNGRSLTPITYDDIFNLAHKPSYQPNATKDFTRMAQKRHWPSYPVLSEKTTEAINAIFTAGYLLGVCRKEKRRVSATYAKAKIKKAGWEIIEGGRRYEQ